MGRIMSFAKAVSGFVTLKGYEQFECVDVMSQLKTLFNGGAFGDWFMILHYDDENPDTGEVESPHVHYYVENRTRKRVSTDINDISKALGCDPRAVTCSPCGDQVATAQYFIHKGFEPKPPHPREEIWTNIDPELMNLMLDTEIDRMTPERLQGICLKCEGSRVKIMKELGLCDYKKLRWLINDVCDELFPKSRRLPSSSQPITNKNA